MEQSIEAIVDTAWQTGQGIDLSGVVFGPALPNWKNPKFTDVAHPYYYFLAGFVRSQACNRILEIGTHYGGSGLSMLRGVAEPGEARVLSLDITDLNPALHEMPGFTKFTGNANGDPVMRNVLDHFGTEPIDMIYLDTNHSFVPSALSMGVYALLLRPRYVILDDINLSDDMRLLWGRLRAMYPESVDVSAQIPAVRVASAGFGVVQLRP